MVLHRRNTLNVRCRERFGFERERLRSNVQCFGSVRPGPRAGNRSGKNSPSPFAVTELAKAYPRCAKVCGLFTGPKIVSDRVYCSKSSILFRRARVACSP